jgi:hypothetical protein
MRYLHALSALSALLVATLVLAGAAEARTNKAQTANTDVHQTGDTDVQMSDSDLMGADELTTGTVSLTPAQARKKRFKDCMAIWEPATHMTKREWRRTCNSQLDEAPDL